MTNQEVDRRINNQIRLAIQRSAQDFLSQKEMAIWCKNNKAKPREIVTNGFAALHQLIKAMYFNQAKQITLMFPLSHTSAFDLAKYIVGTFGTNAWMSDSIIGIQNLLIKWSELVTLEQVSEFLQEKGYEVKINTITSIIGHDKKDMKYLEIKLKSMEDIEND